MQRKVKSEIDVRVSAVKTVVKRKSHTKLKQDAKLHTKHAGTVVYLSGIFLYNETDCVFLSPPLG